MNKNNSLKACCIHLALGCTAGAALF